MIEIDGSMGEGGGQVLRTSVAMSAISGEPVRISNIRAGRGNPGLRPQHLKAVEAVGLLCDAQVTGLSVGSKDVEFVPHAIKGGRFRLDVGTAGSITLVLQALLPVALSAPDEVQVEVIGGTDVSHSPSVDYFEHVFLPMIRKMGCEAEVEVLERGFYPKGGGQVSVSVKPWVYDRRLSLIEAGALSEISAISTATEDLRKNDVAQRQAKGFLKKMPPHNVGKISSTYVQSPSTGTSFLAAAKYENTVIGSCVLGERGLKAEQVGINAAEGLLSEMASGAPLDSHMADQILPYLALTGGKVRVSQVTSHAKTNMEIINLFGHGLVADGNVISRP